MNQTNPALPKPWAYDLWKLLHDEHGLTLLESELIDIIRVVTALKSPELPGDVKALVNLIADNIAENFRVWRTKEHSWDRDSTAHECLIQLCKNGLTELHTQHQREIASLREENEQWKRFSESKSQQILKEIEYLPTDSLVRQYVTNIVNNVAAA